MAREIATELPASEVRRHLRRSWRHAGFVFAIALVLGGWGLAEWRQERVLEDGPRTEGEVVERRLRRQWPDSLVVRYQVEGRRYQEALPADIDGRELGDRIEIIYDPSDPSHARPVQGWSPTFVYLWALAPAVALAAFAIGVIERHRARAAIRAVDDGTGRRMWMRHFRRWSWGRRGHQHLAALWPSESEPSPDDAPVLAVEVEPSDAKHLEDGLVVVHGDLHPGGRAILAVPGHTIWPRSKSRSELPPGVKPV